jgi:hypothetical protein
MTIQSYLEIQNNVVTNVVIWDGDINTWQPPTDATILIQATTTALLWQLDVSSKTYILVPVVGAGQIGFTWNGTVLTTNEPQPIPPIQPISTGTKLA